MKIRITSTDDLSVKYYGFTLGSVWNVVEYFDRYCSRTYRVWTIDNSPSNFQGKQVLIYIRDTECEELIDPNKRRPSLKQRRPVNSR